MRVKLQNFIGEWVEFDIGESATILCAILRKISGDEVLDVVRRNKAIKTYDFGIEDIMQKIEKTWNSDVFVNGDKNLGVISMG